MSKDMPLFFILKQTGKNVWNYILRKMPKFEEKTLHEANVCYNIKVIINFNREKILWKSLLKDMVCRLLFAW